MNCKLEILLKYLSLIINFTPEECFYQNSWEKGLDLVSKLLPNNPLFFLFRRFSSGFLFHFLFESKILKIFYLKPCLVLNVIKILIKHLIFCWVNKILSFIWLQLFLMSSLGLKNSIILSFIELNSHSIIFNL